jgi:hypothetical protein
LKKKWKSKRRVGLPFPVLFSQLTPSVFTDSSFVAIAFAEIVVAYKV